MNRSAWRCVEAVGCGMLSAVGLWVAYWAVAGGRYPLLNLAVGFGLAGLFGRLGVRSLICAWRGPVDR